MDSSHLGDDEEDEVVGEVDIFLAQPGDNCELYVLQYPLRNAKVGIGKDRRVTGVNVRPVHGRIEVKLAVLPDNPDPDDMADDGCDKSFDMTQDLADEKNIGEEQILRSRPNRAAPDSNFSIAAYTSPDNAEDGKACFTVVPLRSVTQLRPTFDYLDAFDAVVAKQRAEEKIARATARGMEVKQPQKEDDGDVAPLQVSFRKRETERAAERRKNSHATLRQKEEGEAWIPVQFVPEGNIDAKHRREYLFNASRNPVATVVKEESLFDAETTYTDLFRSHTRHVQLGLVAKANTDKEHLTIKALRRLPVEAAVAQIITHARLVSFRDLLQLVREEAQVNEVLNATRIQAVCLRGCWVAKKGNRKGLGKLKAASERYEASRVLILNMFRTDRVIPKISAMQVLGQQMQTSEDSVVSILQEVADWKRGMGWQFRLEDDDNFMMQYSELCRTQEQDWDRRVASATETLTKKKKKKKR